MNTRLTFAMLVAVMVFLAYFVISGSFKITENKKTEVVADPNQTPLDLFYEYMAILKDAKAGEELLPYHNNLDQDQINILYGSMKGFLGHEKYYMNLRNVKIISDNMHLRNPLKKLQYIGWHVPTSNRITGEITIKKQNGFWVISRHTNEVKELHRSRPSLAPVFN